MTNAAQLSSQPMHTFRFRAMNTNVDCSFFCPDGDPAELEAVARDWFARMEQRFSRFRPDSELSHLNWLAGERCMVSAAMIEVLQLAQSYKRLTEGAFDPYIMDALRDCGYNDTFDAVRQRASSEVPAPGLNGRRAEPSEMIIDPFMKSLELPASVSLDLGGIVKSWTVKRLAGMLRLRHGIRCGLVSAGGDLAAWGASDTGYPRGEWRIAIEDPWNDEANAGMLAFKDGAAATSGSLGRRWMTNRGSMHHLIDPATMLPSDSDVVQCTVAGSDPVECEIWSKTLCILGSERGLALFARKAEPGCEALLFTQERKTIFCGEQAPPQSRWRNIRIDRFEARGMR